MVAVDKRRKQVAESDVELLMNIAGEEGTIPNQNEPEEIMSESIGPEHATTQQEGQGVGKLFDGEVEHALGLEGPP